MTLLIISQFYPPDLGAVAFRMEAIVKNMTEKGHLVYVLTATPNRYSDYKINSLPNDDQFIHRVTLKYTSKSIFSRILGFFEFYIKILRIKNKYQSKSIDIVISTTPYILEGLAGQTLSKYLKAKHVLDVRDLWPDTPIALGKIKKYGFISFILKIIEKRLYRRTDLIIVTSPGYINHITKITKKNIPKVILNGIDDGFETLYKNRLEKFLPEKNNRIRILYAGNIGIAQNLVTLIRAAQKVDPLKYEFTLIGSGTQLNQIKSMVQQFNLTNINLLPPVQRDTLIDHYLSHDVFYLQLHSNKYFYSVIPSKIFEYLLFNKPIIYGLEGVAKEILTSYQGTFYVEPDNENELINILLNAPFKDNIKRDINKLRRKEQISFYSEILESMMEGNKQ
jgi:glycosyltransferase involved in cell wall biosynthesis